MSKIVIENLLKMHITRAEMIKNGFSAQKYDDVCRGRSSYKVDDLIKISEKFQLTLDFLIKGTNIDTTALTEEEKNLLNVFSKLSPTDKTRISERAETLAELAAERAAEQTKKTAKPDEVAADEQSAPSELQSHTITYFDYAASAGTGLFLDETTGEELSVVRTPEALRADFAIPIKGDSMEPDFSSGDVVLVESCPCVSRGEIGIFVLDGEAFIKEFGGNCLISHNPEYAPKMLTEFTGMVCLGRVLGKAEIIK